MSLTLR